MGGSYDARTLTGATQKEIEKVWNEMVEDDLHENGHSYSGSIGMLGSGFDLHGGMFSTENEADDYISENQDKWDGAMAVRILNKNGDKLTLRIGGWCSS